MPRKMDIKSRKKFVYYWDEIAALQRRFQLRRMITRARRNPEVPAAHWKHFRNAKKELKQVIHI